MGKIIANMPLLVQVQDQDLRLMRKRHRDLSEDAVIACAAARSAAREAHLLCGPGIAAVSALMDGLPSVMQRKWAQQALKSAA